jgi:hypothetical protein
MAGAVRGCWVRESCRLSHEPAFKVQIAIDTFFSHDIQPASSYKRCPLNSQPSAFKPSSKFTLNKIVPVRLLESFTHISSCHVTSRHVTSRHVTSGSLMFIRSLLNTIRQYIRNISTLSCLSARIVRLFLTDPDLYFILLSCLYTRTYYRISINGYRNIVYDAITHRSNATRGIYIYVTSQDAQC